VSQPLGDLDFLKTKLTNIYRAKKREMLRAESENIRVPSPQLVRDADELSGVLKGLLKAIQMIEVRMSGAELPFMDGEI
jgi:hypothetical protein